MKRENLAFLLAGLAFGVLIGFGSYHAVHSTPTLDVVQSGTASATAPQGPMAPTQSGDPNAAGGAPMVARVNDLKRMLQEKPDDPEVLLALANLYYDAAMWEQAAGYYERVAQVEPNADLLTDLGVCYRGLRQFDKAIEIFARAHEQDPTHWQSLYNTIIVAGFDTGRIEVARQALASMEAIEPPPPELEPARLQQLREMLEQAARTAAEQS